MCLARLYGDTGSPCNDRVLDNYASSGSNELIGSRCLEDAPVFLVRAVCQAETERRIETHDRFGEAATV
jgi:hypothetical protein